MHNPQFKIFGIERRKKKNELAQMESFLKSFWYYHQLDVDMCSILSCDQTCRSDEEAKAIFVAVSKKAKELRELLEEAYEGGAKRFVYCVLQYESKEIYQDDEVTYLGVYYYKQQAQIFMESLVAKDMLDPDSTNKHYDIVEIPFFG